MTSLEELKQNLIAEIEKQVSDKILENENAVLLTKLIKNADSEIEARNIAMLGTTYKRTGFYFNKKLEKISDETYLVKNEELSFKTSDNAITHKLIIGDNYPALQNLLISYKNKIKVIYIDPPYGKDNKGKFAKTNYNNAIARDNLLSSLYTRLKLARDLLKDDGVIFCSIDDKNQAYIKCLFDEIFGEENFVSSFVWQKKSGGGQAKYFYEGHEYILIYAKKKDLLNGLFKEKTNSKNIETDFIRKIYGRYTNNQKLKFLYEKYPNDIIEHRNLMFEELEIFKNENLIKQEKYDEIKEKLNNGIYFLKPYNEKFNLICKYNDSEISLLYSIIKDVWNSDGATELESLFNGISLFSNPKPTNLLKILINSVCDNNDIVLDFYAGSGTTGHAVLELNKKDGGNRQFILCTNNETTEINPNGIAYDVTSKRLKRIMTGECYDGTKPTEWLKNNEPYGDNLEVLEIKN